MQVQNHNNVTNIFNITYHHIILPFISFHYDLSEWKNKLMKFLQHKKKSLKDQIPIVIFMIFSHLWHTHLLLHHFTLQWRKWLPKMMGFNSEFFWFYNHFILFFQQRVSHIHIFLYEPEYDPQFFTFIFTTDRTSNSILLYNR